MGAEFDNISFEMPKSQSNDIKVIGVGGGGSNAVNHMYSKQIHGVDFVICNTDAQALENSSIPNKIQLGAHLTSGLGAGANPEIGAQAAAESIQEIQQLLSAQTKMVFITAGMGGGTGTGAAPIIAKIAKDMDILVVGIVTMPFQFEGRMRTKQAQKGVDELRKNVDSLIVINNNKLREVYGNLGFKAGFSKADEVLSTAAKGIAEVITHHYKQNIDLHDAKTVLSDSGTAIMGSARESGANRAKNAIVKALDSPLLNDNKITGAKNVLLLIVSGKNEVTLDEIGEINDFIQEEAGYDANIIMGVGEDESLEDGIAVTVVATGFAADQQNIITNTEVKKIVHTLEDEQKVTYNFEEKGKVVDSTPNNQIQKQTEEQKIIHVLEDEDISNPTQESVTNKFVNEIEVEYDEVIANSDAEFIITNITSADLHQEEIQEKEEVTQGLLFDMPLEVSDSSVEEEKTVCSDVDLQEEGLIEKRYVLQEFDVQPTIGKSSSPTIKKEIEEELQFRLKTKPQQEEKEEAPINGEEQVSPLSLTISQLKKRAQERKDKMRSFNYKFSDQIGKNIDEIEKQPAYKRKGLDVDVNSSLSNKETKLYKDDDELNLSNNSFLHDNVD